MVTTRKSLWIQRGMPDFTEKESLAKYLCKLPGKPTAITSGNYGRQFCGTLTFLTVLLCCLSLGHFFLLPLPFFKRSYFPHLSNIIGLWLTIFHLLSLANMCPIKCSGVRFRRCLFQWFVYLSWMHFQSKRACSTYVSYEQKLHTSVTILLIALRYTPKLPCPVNTFVTYVVVQLIVLIRSTHLPNIGDQSLCPPTFTCVLFPFILAYF